MYSDIGGKIKVLAKIICIIGIVISVISGLGIIIVASISYNPGLSVLGGLLVIVLGTLFSWLSTFFIYGFGELIDKVTKIESEIKKQSSFDRN